MRAKKSLGQNFLQDAWVIRQIVDALDLSAGDVVVEIGPGQGALTEVLVGTGANVVAIEFDRDLVPLLRSRFGDLPNFELVHDDALRFDLGSLASKGNMLKLVANLPYNISTPILQRLMEQKDAFSRLILMFQREVVKRITAEPGNKERGFLTVLTENAFEVEFLFDVEPTAFRPVPAVWSSVVRLTPKVSDFEDLTGLRKILSSAFAQKRKTILNNLKSVLEDAAGILTSSGIDTNRRAETLTLREWKTIVTVIQAAKIDKPK